MELTSLLQARCAYAGLFTGLYVAMAHVPMPDEYATVMPIPNALVIGILAALAGSFFSASILAIIYYDRFWEHLFVVMPIAVVIGVSIMLLELLIPIFVLQGLLYTILGALLGAVLGFWLHLLICRCGPQRCCSDCAQEGQ